MIVNSILRASVLGFLISQCQAATLESQGVVSVDKGSGFRPATSNMALSGGDRVRALKGCAKILYDNGYSTKVCDGQMTVVFSTPPDYIPTGSLKDAPAAGETPQSPAVVGTSRSPSEDLLPAGLLVAAGVGTAVAIATSTVDKSMDETRAASP